MIPYLAFAGWSGSGKTTLLESVVSILAGRGIKVAVIKHGHHDFVDSSGKDTARYAAAGAGEVIYAGPNGLAIWRRHEDAPSLADALAQVTGADVIIVEGFKREPGPKIEVRRGGFPELPSDEPGEILAVVTDEVGETPAAGEVRLDINSPEQVADFVAVFLAEQVDRR